MSASHEQRIVLDDVSAAIVERRSPLGFSVREVELEERGLDGGWTPIRFLRIDDVPRAMLLLREAFWTLVSAPEQRAAASPEPAPPRGSCQRCRRAIWAEKSVDRGYGEKCWRTVKTVLLAALAEVHSRDGPEVSPGEVVLISTPQDLNICSPYT